MIEKDFEIEIDFQYIKNLFKNCTCAIQDTKFKLSDLNQIYLSRKDFIIYQFQSILFDKFFI